VETPNKKGKGELHVGARRPNADSRASLIEGSNDQRSPKKYNKKGGVHLLSKPNQETIFNSFRREDYEKRKKEIF